MGVFLYRTQILSVPSSSLLVQFVERVFHYSGFESLVLPHVLRHCRDSLATEDGLRKGLCLLTKLVLVKAPLCSSGMELESWERYNLDFDRKVNTPSERNFPQAVLDLLILDSSVDLMERQHDYLHALICLPHLKPLDEDRVAGLLKQLLKHILELLRCCREDYTVVRSRESHEMDVDVPSDEEEQNRNKRLLFIFSVALEVCAHMLESGTLLEVLELGVLEELLRNVQDIKFVHLLRTLDVLLTSLHLKNKGGVFRANLFEKLFHKLKVNLSSPYSDVRLVTLHIFSLFERSTHNTSSNHVLKDWSMFSQCLAAESVLPTVQDYRDKLQQLQALSYETVASSLTCNSAYSQVPLRYLLGVLFVNFQLLWKPVTRLVVSYARGLPSAEFWEVFHEQLSLAVQGVKMLVENPTPLPLGLKCDVLNNLYTRLNYLDDKPDYVNYRILLWNAMTEFPEVEEYMRSSSETSRCCDVRKSADREEVEDMLETKAKGPSQKAPQYHSRSVAKTLLAHLAIFTKIQSPRSMFREPELCKLYHDFLGHKNSEVQKLALEQLFRLIDDQTFRNELAAFRVDKEGEVVQDEHRSGLMPVIMRILFSKMSAKTGPRTGGKAGGVLRRSLVLKFLAGCEQDEMMMFVQMLFDKYSRNMQGKDKYSRNMRDEPASMVHTIHSSLDLAKVPHPKRVLSSLNLLQVVLQRLGSLMGYDVLTHLVRVLLTSCLEAFTYFFNQFESYPWSIGEIDAVFRVMVFPYLEKLPIEGIHSPTALLKLFSAWSKQPRCFVLLVKHVEGQPTLCALPHIMKLLGCPKTRPSVTGTILEMVERLLTLEDYEGDARIPTEPVLSVDTAAVARLNCECYILMVSVYVLYVMCEIICCAEHMCVVKERLNYGSCLLLPHVGSLLAYLHSRLTASKRRSRLSRQELSVLSRVSELASDPITSDSLLRLLLPLLGRGRQEPPETVVMDLLTSVGNLISQVPQPHNYLRSLAPLFGTVSHTAPRKLLCLVLESIGKRCDGDKALVLGVHLVVELNAWDARWVEQPDFIRRLDAFKQVHVSLDAGEIGPDIGAIIIHNCFYILRKETDLSLRDSAGYCIRRVAPALCNKYKDVGPDREFLVSETVLNLVRVGIRDKNESMQHEAVALLGEMCRECDMHPVLRDLAKLANKADPEVDFFENLLHLQSHRKTRALLKFCLVARELTKPPNTRTLTQFILPLASSYLCCEKFATKNSIVDAAIEAMNVNQLKLSAGTCVWVHTERKMFPIGGGRQDPDNFLWSFIAEYSDDFSEDTRTNGVWLVSGDYCPATGVVCRLLPWHQYETVLRYYLTKLGLHIEYQKQLVRIVVAILDAFHFDLSRADIKAVVQRSKKTLLINSSILLDIEKDKDGESVGDRSVDTIKDVEGVGDQSVDTIKDVEGVGDQSVDTEISIFSEKVELNTEELGTNIDADKDKVSAKEGEASMIELGEAMTEEDQLEEDLEAAGHEEEVMDQSPPEQEVITPSEPAVTRNTILPRSTAGRVIRVISLHRCIAQRTQAESSHKVNKRQRGFDSDKEDILRIPVALAAVKLLQRLPSAVMEQNLPGILMKLCTFLKSRLDSVRRVTRETLQQIMVALGPSHLATLVKEMMALLTRGFEVHVLVYTVHSIMVALKGLFKAGDIDGCLQDILEVCQRDLFGSLAEEKEVVQIARNVQEARSTKSFHTFSLLAQFISDSCLTDLLLPLKQMLTSSFSHKIISRVSECLRHIVMGLTDNTFLSVESLLIFTYGVTSDSIPELTSTIKKKELTPTQREKLSRRQVDTFIIPAAPRTSRPLSLSSALAQAMPPTLSTAWTAPQPMFSKPSVTSSPLYSAPKRTPVSIGSPDGHCLSSLHASMESPCFSHWTRPGSSSNLFNSLSLSTITLPPTATHVAGTSSCSTATHVAGRSFRSTATHVAGTSFRSTVTHVAGTSFRSTATNVAETSFRSTATNVAETSFRSTATNVAETSFRSTATNVAETSFRSTATNVAETSFRSTATNVAGTSFRSTTTNVAGTLSPTFFLPYPHVSDHDVSVVAVIYFYNSITDLSRSNSRYGAITATAKVSANTNTHVLVEFGLRLFHTLLKKERLRSGDYRGFVDPLVPLITNCLNAPQVKLATLCIQCLSWVLKMDLPSIRANIDSISSSLFALLHKYAVAGLSKGDNFSLVVATFKAVTVLVRDVKSHNISEDQLKTLLLYAEQDIHDHSRQATAFSLLKAILSRKLVVPEMGEVMNKVAVLSVTSELGHVRMQARQVFHQFLMDYPLGKKLTKHLGFHMSQLNYEMKPGRESVLEMIHTIITTFPLPVLDEQSELFFMMLGARLVNDEAPECRKMVAQTLKALLGRLPNNTRDQLFDIVMLWLQDSKVSHRQMSVQLCGIFVQVEQKKFERRLVVLVPVLLDQLAPTSCTDDLPGRFVRAVPVVESSNWSEEEQRQHDHRSSSTAFNLWPDPKPLNPGSVEVPHATSSVEDNAQLFLAHSHEWVRLAGAQLLGHVFSSLDPQQIAAAAVSCTSVSTGVLMTRPRSELRSLVLDLCAVLQLGNTLPELVEQVIKNLVFLARILQGVSEQDTQSRDQGVDCAMDDEEDESRIKISLAWMIRRMRRIVNTEIIQTPKSTQLVQ
uniref:Uncharacterized protein n=1 Tax=Timema genevievae TaxID=629358 RepID=A0A7R9JSU0_TIMGE|nr:unnamed protein product [Timema genevievae]